MSLQVLFRYAIAGTINTLTAFLIYTALIKLLSAPFWAANFVGVSASIVSGYLLGRYFVFPGSGRPLRSSGWRYLATFGIQYLLGTSLIAAGLSFGLSAIAAYVVAVPPMIGFSFLLQQFWVFSRAPASSE